MSPRVEQIPCATCGRPRSIKVDNRYEIRLAASRHCPPCAGRIAWDSWNHEPDIDHIVIERLTLGSPVRSNSAERREAIRRLEARGLNTRQIAERIHTTIRSVERLRKTMREQDAA